MHALLAASHWARVPSDRGIASQHACNHQPSQALSQGNSRNGGWWNDRDGPDGSMTVCCSPKAAVVYGDDEPLDPGLALWCLSG